jgi:hypothetical protein
MTALIKQRTKIKEVRKPFKLPVDVLAELELYSEFLNERKDFIVAEGLRACFKSDSTFKESLAKPEQQTKLVQLQARLTTSKRGKTALMPSVA